MNEFRGMRVINDEIKMVEKIQIEKVREKKKKESICSRCP